MQPPWPSRRLLQGESGADGGVANPNPNRIPGIPPADPPSGVNSDIVVILAALLCALICIIGLAAVTRCARSRRNRAANSDGGAPASPTSSAADAALFAGAGADGVGVTTTTTSTTTTAKGLKKKALRALPKLAYEDAVAAAVAARGGAAAVAGGGEGEDDKILAECAICLSEFEGKEEIRVLPQCGHGFHVACVDTWLGAHSSCPSCRRVLVVDATPKLPPERARCGKCEATEEASASSSSGVGFLP